MENSCEEWGMESATWHQDHLSAKYLLSVSYPVQNCVNSKEWVALFFGLEVSSLSGGCFTDPLLLSNSGLACLLFSQVCNRCTVSMSGLPCCYFEHISLPACVPVVDRGLEQPGTLVRLLLQANLILCGVLVLKKECVAHGALLLFL